jgi:diguanylate cyclase (GGDEF)-like protein
LPSLEAQARREVKRLESLWRIVNSPDLRGDNLVNAMLREAAVAMRPGHAYAGTLGHIEGAEHVLDAVGGDFGENGEALRGRFRVGLRTPLSDLNSVRDLSAGRTQSWDDCQLIPGLPARTRESGLRSQITTRFVAAGAIHVLTFGTREPPSGTPFGPEDYAYIELLGSFFARHIELKHMQHALVDAELYSRQRAERLESLWRIVNASNLRGDDLVNAMLQEASVAMRPGQAYAGTLGHIEGPEYVLDALGGDFGPDDELMRRQLPVGLRMQRSGLVIVRDLDAGRTQSWDDCQTLSDLPERTRSSGLRSQITTKFLAAGTLHVLSFGTREAPTGTPFGPDDYAYIELLGSFFARHIELEHAQHALVAAELHSRQHAERLESLWRIVNTSNLRNEELLLAMLREAAVAIRPGQDYLGTLGHLDGSYYVHDASIGAFEATGTWSRSSLRVGERVERSRLVRVRYPDGGRTQTWDDCQTLPDLPDLARKQGLRSQIATQFAAGETTYVLALGSREATSGKPFGPEDREYIELLGSIFARQLEYELMQAAIGEAELRARQHAERLETLSQIANNPTLSGEPLMFAMLHQAAAAIRPPQLFRGHLGRIEGDDIVVLGIAVDPADNDPRATHIQVGQRRPLARSIVPRAGRTEGWADVATLPTPPLAATALGWRAVISTLFDTSGSHYVLTFSSLEPASKPFSAEDLSYIDVLASSFAKQLEVNDLEDSLRREEERARQHGERLETLWQIANNPTLRGEESIVAMLRQAAKAIRPPQRFRGALGRIEGDEVVVIGVGMDPADNGPDAMRLTIGRRSPLSQTIIPRVGRTEAWEDLALHNDFPGALRILGWRAVISTQFDAGGSRYSLTFASPEPAATPFSDSDLAYVNVLASSFAKQLELEKLESSLREEEERARHHSDRLEALWKVVNDPNLRGEELLRAMLGQAGAAIRSDQDFRGMLWRVKGTDMVVESLSQFADTPDNLQSLIGTAVPLERTIIGAILAEGTTTRSWNDVETSPYRSDFSAAHQTHAMIVTTFKAGATTWGISFISSAPAIKPLSPQDHVFVEVLASFFANHVQQLWQFERLQYQQAHDVLTGLLNRSQFRSVVRSTARTTKSYAIILVDIDAFREINESYGHMIGDALLVEVGNALRLRAADDEIVGRIGDDVFGVYIGNPISKEFVLSRALSFAEAFSSGFSTGDREGKEFIARTAGLGIAVAPDDGLLIDAILAHADTALIKAKERGHGSLVFYEAGMEGDAHRRTSLRNEIAEAIAGDQFELYYQPHIEIATGNVTGCEALVRWNHPVRGLLLPQHFIPFAEQSGIIAGIDSWVMEHVCDAANELAALRPGLRLYFNLSGRQAGDPMVVRALTDAARRGVVLENLGVEITETDAMRDVEATRHVCRALRRLNVRIAIDDFGTGYSSLSSLKRLPVDIVKIDRSFIAGVLTDPHDEAIADTIISIAARFGFESLAEGVEDVAAIGWLRQRSCRYMQGFAISRPLPIDAFKAWLAGHES